MLRRRCGTSLTSTFQKRFGGGGPVKNYDHSASFSRQLTASESEALAQQKNRTVSSVIPGKLFMRHWLAGEQATVSIFNRGVSLGVTAGLVLWATFSFGNGNSNYSAVQMMCYTTFCLFLVLHTHMPQLYAAFAVPYVVALLR